MVASGLATGRDGNRSDGAQIAARAFPLAAITGHGKQASSTHTGIAQ